MKVQLLISSPSDPEFPFQHDGPTIRIGRNPSCELSLQGDPNQTVSWEHARIELTDRGAFLTDLDSTNGTLLNGERITSRSRLSIGDQIGLGKTGPKLKVIVLDLSPGDKAPLRPRRRPLSKAPPSEPPPKARKPERPPVMDPVHEAETQAAPVPPSPPAAKPGLVPRPRSLPEVFGRYRILRQLGGGSMGSVYLAQDTQLDRAVALKVPNFKSDNPVQRERFYREARGAATLQHPNLCPIYDVGEIEDIPYLTMAYIEGKPLAEIVRPEMPVAPAVNLVRKLALALEEAHQRGVLHRDLKPSNIIINQRGEPVIIDFGLARVVNRSEARLTQEGDILGSPAYMSPEQAAGNVASMGPEGDIYSLGVILYELLTGVRPFQGKVMEVLHLVLTREPPPPSEHRADLDPRLEAICRKAMAKKAAARYPSMAEFAAALTEYLRSIVKASR